MKTTSDLYGTDRLKWPYKSGVNKIIGSVDRVAKHCLSAAFWIVTDRRIDLARDLYSLDFLALPFASRQKVANSKWKIKE
ncbi:hypothetical protein [Edaphocola flava]|uniref:hypothetical protein n=1 Tax=Edaphocola flava TaxID=2499629 RepID=UPI00100BED23|nr:hypothetical protein [Edaphocola flava]